MNFVIDKKLGYKYTYIPGHPLANNAGKVYEHIYVATRELGRNLNPGECVHHIDRDRSNNSPDNLLVLSKSEHASLHRIEDWLGEVGAIKTVEDFHRLHEAHIQDRSNICQFCGKSFIAPKRTKKFCSLECSRSSNSTKVELKPTHAKVQKPKQARGPKPEKFPKQPKQQKQSEPKQSIGADELRELVWKYPTTHVAKMLGVSDVTITNYCKKLGVDKPPRGYWAKQGHHSFNEKIKNKQTINKGPWCNGNIADPKSVDLGSNPRDLPIS